MEYIAGKAEHHRGGAGDALTQVVCRWTPTGARVRTRTGVMKSVAPAARRSKAWCRSGSSINSCKWLCTAVVIRGRRVGQTEAKKVRYEVHFEVFA